MTYPLLFGAGALCVYMCALYTVSLLRRDNGTADIGYGIAFIVLAASLVSVSEVVSFYVIILCVLLGMWGIRLALRIGKKNFGKQEDFRYRKWREEWGSTFAIRSFLQIYMLQGLVVFVVALPITLPLAYPSSGVFLPLFLLGVFVWCVGFFFEVVGDYQLDRFIMRPENKGSIMQEGLWRYSRHPNYFGESTMWWGLALASSSLTSISILVYMSPVLITYLLLFVSGVPMLEKKWEGNPAWETYKRRTSVFFPLPPRSKEV